MLQHSAKPASAPAIAECPVCCRALEGWDLAVKAAHINRCLDGQLSSTVAACPISAAHQKQPVSTPVSTLPTLHVLQSQQPVAAAAKPLWLPAPTWQSPGPSAGVMPAGQGQTASVVGAPANVSCGSGDVREWLQARGLERHADAFEQQEVDLILLPTLTDDDLLSMGVSQPGARRVILTGAARLPPPVLASTTIDSLAGHLQPLQTPAQSCTSSPSFQQLPGAANGIAEHNRKSAVAAAAAAQTAAAAMRVGDSKRMRASAKESGRSATTGLKPADKPSSKSLAAQLAVQAAQAALSVLKGKSGASVSNSSDVNVSNQKAATGEHSKQGPDGAKGHGERGSAPPPAVKGNALAALMQPGRSQLTSASAVRSVATKRKHVIPAPDDSFNRQREQELFEGAYPVAVDVKIERCEDCTRVLLPLSALGFSGRAKRVRVEDSLWRGTWECRPSLERREPTLEQRALKQKVVRQALPPSYSSLAAEMHYSSVAVTPSCDGQNSSRSAHVARQTPPPPPGIPGDDSSQGKGALPSSWTANQIAALRQELKAAENTVEGLKIMLRDAEAAVQS